MTNGKIINAFQALSTHAFTLSFVIAVVLVGYMLPTSGGLTYFSHDTTEQQYVMLRSHVEDLRNNGIVGWCPGLGTGHYRLANPTYGVWSPRVLLFLLISGYSAQHVSIILYAIWGAIGSYALGYYLTKSRLGGIYAGMTWQLSGPIMSLVMSIAYFASAAWLPWALVAWLRNTSILRRACMTAFCTAMITFEGDLFGGYIMLSLIGLLAIFDSETSRLKAKTSVLVWALALVIHLLLTSIVWIPALQMLPESERASGLHYSGAMSFSLDPRQLVELVAPGFWGQPHEGSFWAPWHNLAISGTLVFHTAYFGFCFPALLIAGLSSSTLRSRRFWIFLAIAVVTMLFSFGKYFFPYKWLFEHLSPIRVFRFPAKLFVYSSLFMIAGSCLIVPRLLEGLNNHIVRRRLFWGIIVPSVLALAVMSYFVFSNYASILSSPKPDVSISRIKIDFIRIVIVVTAFSLYTLLAHKTGGVVRQVSPIILVAFLGADLYFARPIMSTVSRQSLESTPRLASALVGYEHERIIVSANLYSRTPADRHDSLLPNWGILNSLSYAFGQTASLPSRILELASPERLSSNGRAICRLLAARHVITAMERGDRRVEVLDYSEEFGKSFSDPSLNIEVISYTTPAPYAFTTESVKSTIDRNAALQLALSQRAIPGSDLYTFIPQDLAIDDGSLAAAAPFKSDIGREAIADGSKFKPLSKDAVVRPTGDRIVVRVQNDRSAVLVLREYLMPGWRAFIDGAQSPIYFADGIGMAVFVPSGFHTIDYTFTSPGLRVGEMLTIITLIVMISSIILTLRPIRGHV